MPTKNTGRITDFFEKLDKRIYRDAMSYMRDELDRIRNLTHQRAELSNPSIVQQTFFGLTRPRESLLRFSETRVILSERPAETLDQLLGKFVEREFSNKEYHDQVLERRVRETLRRADLRDYFRPDDIGNDGLHIHVPFVYQLNGHPKFAIKPLDLAKDEPNKIFELGGHWVDRVRRLRKHHLLPDHMLFAVKLPPLLDQGIKKAADEIICELQEQHVRVVPVTNNKAIAEFAAGARRQ
jgi:hypothetical protein